MCDYEYFINDTPESVNVTLRCKPNEYAVPENIQRSIPKSMNNTKKTKYSSYCRDKSDKHTTCEDEPCTCCSKPWYASELCHHTSKAAAYYKQICRNSPGVCNIDIKRYDFHYSGNNNCLDYFCNCQTDAGDSSWCYVRWATVNYTCVPGVVIIFYGEPHVQKFKSSLN